jgi:ferric-dicitrate binding protein FerR (iron transport regulator)
MSERNRGNGEHDSVSAAVRWLLKVEHDDPSNLSDEDHQAWASWAADPANLKRFRLAQRLWRSLNSAAAGVSGRHPG